MSKTIRVPDPVYDRLEEEANEKDVNIGTVVKDWMEKFDRENTTIFQILNEDLDG